MSKKNVHVVPHQDGWAVKRAGAERVSSVHETKDAAVRVGRASAKAGHVELVIHNRDGQIADSDSFGRDPCPPRDKRH